MKRITHIILVFLILLSSSCNEEGLYDTLPYVYVNVQINLNNIEYLPLRNDNGWVYIENEGLSGIIIYRESSLKYHAYERQSHHRPDESCSIVSMDDAYILREGCDSSSYSVLTGYPISGIANVPLRRYYAFVQGDYLHVDSE